MANCSSKRSLLLAFLVAATLFSSGIGAEECKEDLNKLIEFCKSYVVIPGPAVPPLAQCCGVVKNVNIPCLCKYVTKSVQKTISMKKVVYVSQQCGSLSSMDPSVEIIQFHWHDLPQECGIKDKELPN